jgi:hypothetical protein
MKSNNSISIQIDSSIILNGVNHNINPTSLTINHRIYYNIESFIKTYNVNKTFVRRQIKLVENRDFDLYFYRVLNKLWVTEALLHLNSASMSKLAKIEGTWAKYMQGFEWDFFGTVSFKNKYSQNTVRSIAETYVKRLTTKYYGKGLRIFYAIEKNPEWNSGFHFHFLLWLDSENKPEVKKFTEGHFRGSKGTYGNTQMVTYDPSLGASAYMLKQSHLLEDSIDIISRNLDF